MPNKILVIEDDPLIRNNLEEILSLSGFSVVTAGNGQAGLQMVTHEQPNLILCDVMMPELDGYSVLKALRQNPKTASIPVVLLTAQVDRPDPYHTKELGADYLAKPFTVAELVGLVTSHFEPQRVSS